MCVCVCVCVCVIFVLSVLYTNIWVFTYIFFPADLGSKRFSCGQIVDEIGNHLLGCGQNNVTTRRHDALCDVLFYALLVDNGNYRKGQRCNTDTCARQGDIFHPDFEQGYATYFDLTVRNTMQPSFLTQSAYNAGNAAAPGEMEKDHRHEANVTSTGSIFHFLVCESLGLWLPHSLEVLKTIARRLSFTRNLAVSQVVSSIHEQLSVKLWLYNAKMIWHRLALDCTNMFSE